MFPGPFQFIATGESAISLPVCDIHGAQKRESIRNRFHLAQLFLGILGSYSLWRRTLAFRVKVRIISNSWSPTHARYLHAATSLSGGNGALRNAQTDGRCMCRAAGACGRPRSMLFLTLAEASAGRAPLSQASVADLSSVHSDAADLPLTKLGAPPRSSSALTET